MTPWLAVRGMALVHSLPHVAHCHALNLAAHGPMPMPMPEAAAAVPPPDLTALAPLLARYYGEATPPPLRRVPPYARYGLLAALQALEQAGWTQAHAPQTTLALGTAYSGVCMSMDFMDSMLDQGPRLSSPTAFSHAVNNMGAGLISLLLGLRGSCQTVSQFGLSFAGAVQAAALALCSGRTDRALVGALDETDPRFTLDPHAEGLQPAQGAVFLCLERARADTGPQLRLLWGEAAEKNRAGLTLLSGDAAPEQATADQAATEHVVTGQVAAEQITGEQVAADGGRAVCLGPCYGHTPLAQALDTYLALRLETEHTVRCLCADARYGAAACVEVRR